jgi:enoyl-CoA hydratase
MAEKCNDLLLDRVGTEGRVARITFNRPEVLNAMSTNTMGELHRVLRDLEADQTARVITLRGAGRAFSVGHDLKADLTGATDDPNRKYKERDAQGRPLIYNYSSRLRDGTNIQLYLWRIAKITVVQAHGYCLAGGMEFAMMADLITASDDCIFGHPAHRGVGSARNAMILPLVIGMRKAKELFYTGDGLTGKKAAEIGLINYAWPTAELEARTVALADRIANQSADHLAVLKAATNRFYENMGLYSSVYSATDFDAMAQHTQSGYEWQDALKNDGLKSALKWRDEGYTDFTAVSGNKE